MILVTGGAGFVGRHLIKELQAKKYKVACIAAPFENADDLRADGVEVFTADITKRDQVFGEVKGEFDAAFHLAGILTETKQVKFKAIHVDATRNVVDMCLERGIKRLIFTSAFGAAPDAESENHRTKWESEEIVRRSGLIFTIIRPTVIFGPGDRFTNLFAKEIKEHLVIPMPAGGRNKIQPIFVKDLARAMARCLELGGTAGKTYELGGPEIYTFREMIEAIDEVMGKKRIKLHMPIPLMYIAAIGYELLFEKPRLTRDLVSLLKKDYVAPGQALIDVFGIKPVGFKEGMRTYLR